MTTIHTPPEDLDPSRSNRRKGKFLTWPHIPWEGRAEGLEGRLARIENQLQQVLNATQESHQSPPPAQRSANTSGGGRQDGDLLLGGAAEEEARRVDAAITDWGFDSVKPCYFEPHDGDLYLPPLEEILPVVDHYFVTHNVIVPLFNQGAFMRMLNGWYNLHAPRDRGTWAAVQIVMALGYRTPKTGATETTTIQIQLANQCLRNAQAAVSDLVTRDEDLVGIQILLGIVMLFQNSRDPKPASVIIGTAVRLAHRLQLHSNESSQFFTADEVEQRSRVFWVAYALDKDISLRARTPSAQLDDDIDVPLPTMNPEDGVGMVMTRDGLTEFNYHRMRVELSHIEGQVYDLLYSNRAGKVKGQERQRRVDRLQAMLDQWYRRVPTVFQIEHVASTVGPSELLQITKMHHAFLLAEVMTHGIYSRNADWVARISSFSRAAIDDMGHGLNTYGAGCQLSQPAPLPAGWEKCVNISRGCMKLFQEAIPTECLIWQCSCAHFSALIIILSNMSANPSAPTISLDQHLASKAVVLFDKVLEVIDLEQFRTLRAIVGELYKKADQAIEDYRLKTLADGHGDDMFDGLNTDLNMLHPVEDPEFLPPSGDLEGLSGPFMSSFDGSHGHDISDFMPTTVPPTGGSLDAMNFASFMG
ncbi:hypothetical protein G7046_g3059 [Stylonectria norvegica]|nr:hypothetical protein G7046_g3059 [Stylonectria norvegica]